MPGKVKVRVLAGRNLPVMDKSSETSDAFVEVKLANTTYKTDVYRKSLNPYWKSEWFKFEADDEELQDEPLQIRVMDYDTYSANDAIGKVYIDLNPLLLARDAGTSSVMSGWIPIFDTMHGIRGEVNVIVKVELFSDLNRFRESSCGVQFFCVSGCPHGYRVQAIHGFVEELVINDDPEYQWIDKIRTPRASNEARQTLFSKLSGEVQRKTGLKALELGGNAVIGYQQCFDLEGESGIVVRAIGTSVTLVRQMLETQSLYVTIPSPFKDVVKESPVPEENYLQPGSPNGFPPSGGRLSQSPAKCGVLLKTSDTDISIATKVVGCSSAGTALPSTHRSQRPADLEMLEYPFLSMTRFPTGFVVGLGGVVSARSVKLLGRTNSSLDEPETRDVWWTELRMEIRAHARSLGCNVVLGYTESTSISEDVCLFSATGTAAVVNFHSLDRTTVERRDVANERDKIVVSDRSIDGNVIVDSCKSRQLSEGSDDSVGSSGMFAGCRMCHIPYSESSVPFPVSLFKCSVCRQFRVPDLLFATIEIPQGIPITGRGCLVQARVCRPKKDAKGEMNAKEISDSLPFLEYELHKQLLNKLKVKGMNALFGLRIQVSVGAKILVAVATSTGVFLSALPAPTVPKISSVKSLDDPRLLEVQRWIQDTVVRNCDIYAIKQEALKDKVILERAEDRAVDSDDDLPELDLSLGNKDACVLEIDDSEDVDIIALLIDPRVPDGFDVCNTESVPGVDTMACNLQMFTRVWRSRTPASGLNTRQFSQICENIMQSLFFKLRKMVPCALCNLQFFVDIPEDEELQLIILGTAVGIGDSKSSKKPKNCSSTDETVGYNEHDLIFNIDELHSGGAADSTTKPTYLRQVEKFVQPFGRAHHITGKAHHGIDLSSLSHIPGLKIENYLGNLNYFFIRESTTLRESGGLSGFMQSFVAEVLAIVRAHVAALGGNALVSFFLNQCILVHNPHKNQGQCLINVGGDAVQVMCPLVLQEVPDGTGTVRKGASPSGVAVNAAAILNLDGVHRFPSKSGCHIEGSHQLQAAQ